MTKYFKLAFASLIVIALLGCFAARVNAGPHWRGEFTVTRPVQWGQMVLPAGNYSFELNPSDAGLRASELVIVRAGIRNLGLAVPLVADKNCQTCKKSFLLVERHGRRAYVLSLNLPGYRATFPVIRSKRAAEEEMAEAHLTEQIPITAN